MTEAEALEHVWRHFRVTYRRQQDAAKALGVSDAFISAVLTGRKPIPDYILAEAGLRREVSVSYHLVDAAIQEGKQ